MSIKRTERSRAKCCIWRVLIGVKPSRIAAGSGFHLNALCRPKTYTTARLSTWLVAHSTSQHHQLTSQHFGLSGWRFIVWDKKHEEVRPGHITGFQEPVRDRLAQIPNCPWPRNAITG